MVHGILTKLRRAFIFETLLDGNEWHTQEILKEIGDLEYEYYCHFANPLVDNQIFLRPETMEPINNPKLSVILGNLVKEEIIGTRALSRFEKEGSKGSRGNVYWLVKNNKALYLILKELSNPLLSQIYFYSDRIKFLLVSSEYGKKLINKDLIKELIEILNPVLNKREKKFILTTLRISPTALYESLKKYYDDKNYMYNSSDEEILISLKEDFLMDLKFWLYSDIQSISFKRDINVIFDVSVLIKLNDEIIEENSRKESVGHSMSSAYEEFLEYEQFDKEHKPIELLELESKQQSLKRNVYDVLREISEEKGHGKKNKKDRLIKEYYIEINKVNKRIKPLEKKYRIDYPP